MDNLVHLFLQERCFRTGYPSRRSGNPFAGFGGGGGPVCVEFGTSFETSCFALTRLALANAAAALRVEELFCSFVEQPHFRWSVASSAAHSHVSY
jgi:hypothetical protein